MGFAGGGVTGVAFAPRKRVRVSVKSFRRRPPAPPRKPAALSSSPVCPATAPRECGGKSERFFRQGKSYPHYYVTRAVVTRRGERIPLCDDCHNHVLLADEVRRAREEAGADGVARPDAEVLAASPHAAAGDRSPSGHAIEALGAAVVLDDSGEALGLELAERELLPESEARLREEIAAGVLAGDDSRRGLAAYRAQLERYRVAAGASKLVNIVV